MSQSAVPSRVSSPRIPPADLARALYGDAFEVSSDADLADAFADWAALSPAERSFATAQLLYLAVQSQGLQLRALAAVRKQLGEVSKDLNTLLDDLTAPEGDEDTSSEAPAPSTES